MSKMTLLCALTVLSPMFSSEGMWPLNMVPTGEIEKNYGITLEEDWIEHVRLSCLRLSLGGSGSFVSPNGLVMTNHHVGSKAIYNLSSEEKNLIQEGFYAGENEGELKCPNMYIDQLVSIQDVTDEVNRTLEGLSLEEREAQRKKVIAEISAAEQKRTGLQPEMVTLYQGAKYHLYLYKRYTDIRLVMAPEQSIAYFGGDIENFEYPRHDLDVTFFRIYEDDKPLETPHYLKWSKSGPEIEEALFVMGHPGKTERIYTKAHLLFLKEVEDKMFLQLLGEKIACFEAFSAKSEEHKRIASSDLFRFRNGEKVFKATYRGLCEGSIIQDKENQETLLLAHLNDEEKSAFTDLEKALDEFKAYRSEFYFLEGFGSVYSKMHLFARHLVRFHEEKKKPNSERLKEYTESELATVERNLFSEEPIYLEFDEAILVDSLKRIKRELGSDHPAVIIALGEKTIEDRAKELIEGTKLQDREYRKNLYMDEEAFQNASDSFLELAKALDPLARAIRKRYEHEFLSKQKESYSKIAEILFREYGESLYPDATFTLRLSVGEMKGYEDIPPYTSIEEAYLKAREHSFEEPYKLPDSWVSKEEVIDKTVPFNFISTHDIIGGNSGSPMINAKGEVVGLIFDGNVDSLLWGFAFDETKGRAVSVHSEAIVEALKSVYNATSLVEEIRGGALDFY